MNDAITKEEFAEMVKDQRELAMLKNILREKRRLGLTREDLGFISAMFGWDKEEQE